MGSSTHPPNRVKVKKNKKGKQEAGMHACMRGDDERK